MAGKSKLIDARMPRGFEDRLEIARPGGVVQALGHDDVDVRHLSVFGECCAD